MLVAIATLYGNIHLYKKRKNIDSTGLSSYIEACCVWMLFLFTVTEVLSVWHMVRFLSLFGLWGLFDCVLLAVLVFQWIRYGGQAAGREIAGGSQKKRKSLAGWMREMSGCGWRFFREAPYYGILLVIGIIVLFLALVTTPNNWDSMTYHLPRIVHWAQNRSVGHYATNSIRQISSPSFY